MPEEATFYIKVPERISIYNDGTVERIGEKDLAITPEIMEAFCDLIIADMEAK